MLSSLLQVQYLLALILLPSDILLTTSRIRKSMLLTEAFAKPNGDFLLGIDGASVASASEHVCVLEQRNTEDSIGGRAVCWGYGGSGQLDSPRDVDFVQLVAGISFTCGITLEQTVMCWGEHAPKEVPGLYAQITAPASGRFACGVLIDGSLNCWGTSKLMRLIPTGSGAMDVSYVQISCSMHHCCALDSEGYPHCWGTGAVGETKPPLTSYRDYIKSRLADKHAHEVLAPDTEADIYLDESFIEEEHQQHSEEVEEEEDFESDGSETMTAAELDDSDASVAKIQFRQISVGEGNSCGITLLGSHLLCWGKQQQRRVSPPPLQSQGPYRQVSVGAKGVCAILGDITKTTDKHIKLHGEKNAAGVLTGNTVTDQRIREREERRQRALEGLNTKQEDTLECWFGARNLVKADHNSTWDQVAVGAKSVCAVSMNSQLHCWGTKVPKGLLQDLVVA